MRPIAALILVLLSLSCASLVAAQTVPDPLRLRLGDPSRRDRVTRLVLDGITVSSSGDVIDPAELAARLQRTRLLLIGETHTSREAHRVQLQVLRALVETGRPVLVGLEMLPYSQQGVLDQWQKMTLDETAFVRAVGWYEHWGFHWGLYRDLFLFARDRQLPLVALNVPADFTSRVRQGGLGTLTPSESNHLPPAGVDSADAEHMSFLKATVGPGDAHGVMNDDAWTRMLTAQATWDAAFAWQAVQALNRAPAAAIMVVLVGSGHVAYDLGIVRQARGWSNVQAAALIPIEFTNPQGAPVDVVQASYADYVWGIPPESGVAFPMLGISTRDEENGRRRVVDVVPDSAAAAAGFRTGDVLISMDGHDLADRYELNLLMMSKQWGDAARVVVRRGDATHSLVAYFRRPALMGNRR